MKVAIIEEVNYYNGTKNKQQQINTIKMVYLQKARKYQVENGFIPMNVIKMEIQLKQKNLR